MSDNEQFIWEDSSSQALNFWSHFIGFIALVAVSILALMFSVMIFFAIPVILVFMLWNFLSIKSQKYRLTNQRIIMQRGVLNKITDEVELYRVKDHRLEQPFFLRLFGLGNIVIITSDQLNHELVLSALKNAPELRESIRKLVEARRVARGVRELDTH